MSLKGTPEAHSAGVYFLYMSTQRAECRFISSLRLLLQTGLVVHQPRKGFKVRDYTPKQIRQIYTLRANLEGLVIIELEGRELDHLITELKKSNERMETFFRKNQVFEYFKENIFFHQKIIDFADNDILKKTIALVNEVSLPVRY